MLSEKCVFLCACVFYCNSALVGILVHICVFDPWSEKNRLCVVFLITNCFSAASRKCAVMSTLNWQLLLTSVSQKLL